VGIAVLNGGSFMSVLSKVLIGLAGVGFVLAVFAALSGPIYVISAEGFSRASNNLALIAIALSICVKRSSTST
jgi:hypothetical protein